MHHLERVILASPAMSAAPAICRSRETADTRMDYPNGRPDCTAQSAEMMFLDRDGAPVHLRQAGVREPR